jgi:glycosyltransferase involved in cell wall biosynthesis
LTITFSAVITSYNYRAFVVEAIDSALSQTLPALEVIVVDDGSSDGTPEMVSDRYWHDPRVRLIATENRGQLAAFATGVQAATGQIVAFLDADDVWEPGYLAAVAAVYQQHPKVDFVYTNMRFFGAREGVFLKDQVSRDLGLSILLGAYHTRWQASATSALSLQRRLALEVLDLPEGMFRKWRTRADDCISCGTDILGGRKYYLAEPLVRYRAHGDNAWLNKGSDGAAALRHWLQVESMLGHYRSMAGLDASSRAEHLRHVKHEFRSKPQPTAEDLGAYSRLLAQSSLSWPKRIEHRAAMWAHRWKKRTMPIG